MRRRLRSSIGVLLSLFLLWWALRDVSPREVLSQVADADLVLLAAAVLVAISGYYIRAFRWGILLLPVVRDVRFTPRVAATFIGFAANNVLPARVGEFARAFALARLAAVQAPSAFATLVVERLLDGLVLVAILFAAMAAPGFPAAEGVARGAAVVAILMTATGVALGFAIANPRPAAALVHLAAKFLPDRLRDRFIEAMRAFAMGLLVLRSFRLFGASLALAIFQWVSLATSFLLGFRAFGIDDVPFAGALFLQSVISLAVALPSTPGFFGPFEAAARLGLGLWDVPADRAVSFAIGFHIAGFIPVTLIGVYYVWRLGLSWSDVRSSEEVVEGGAGANPRETAGHEIAE